jgi:plasmid stabilization system protein ParE
MSDLCENQTDYKLVILDEANKDIEDLIGFYNDCAGPDSAARFQGAAETLLSALTFWPRSHKIWDNDEKIRRVNFPKHKASVVYRIDDDYYEVIAVAAFHTLQDPKKIDHLISSRVKIAKKWRENNA